jgi:hypothetical protein
MIPYVIVQKFKNSRSYILYVHNWLFKIATQKLNSNEKHVFISCPLLLFFFKKIRKERKIELCKQRVNWATFGNYCSWFLSKKLNSFLHIFKQFSSLFSHKKFKLISHLYNFNQFLLPLFSQNSLLYIPSEFDLSKKQRLTFFFQ